MNHQWKPIESAPKDGSRVLIWHPDYCAPISAQWYGNEGWKMDSDVSPFWRQPTHWMPLPAAPGTPPASAQDDAKDERQAFEEWFTRNDETKDMAERAVRRSPSGAYVLMQTYTAWEVWQAARASVDAPAAGDALDTAINIEAAAKTLAECMDYPWAHMPEQGRVTMREHAQTVIRAASQQQEG